MLPLQLSWACEQVIDKRDVAAISCGIFWESSLNESEYSPFAPFLFCSLPAVWNVGAHFGHSFKKEAGHRDIKFLNPI